MTFDEWWHKEGLLYFGTGTKDDARDIWKAAQEVEREACANMCQGVIDGGEFDGHQQYAAAYCRDAIRAMGKK